MDTSTETAPQSRSHPHEQRLRHYLEQCNFTEREQTAVLEGLFSQTGSEQDTLPTLITRLQSTLTNTEQSPGDQRLASYLGQELSARAQSRRWSMPRIKRSHMAPKDYTPKLIRTLKRLSGGRPPLQSS